MPATQVSAAFLAFSLGKHACPGRFFAVQTIKVMVVWLLLHYEFEVVMPEGKERVGFLEIGEVRLPLGKETGRVRVRRRKVGGMVGESYADVPVREAEKEVEVS